MINLTIKNGETRKPTGLKNGGQGLPGLAKEGTKCLVGNSPAGLVDNQHFGLLCCVIQLAHFWTHLGVMGFQTAENRNWMFRKHEKIRNDDMFDLFTVK